MTVQHILDWLNEIAPFDSQEEFDNSGLQLGRRDQQVDGVLLALDVTAAVIQEAVDQNVQLIITHHPLLFHPQSQLDLARHTPQLVARLLKADISLIAAHTNLDKSENHSASLAVARMLGLTNIRRAGDYLFLGDFTAPKSANELQEQIATCLQVPARCYGPSDKKVLTLAVAGGAFSEGYLEAQQAGAQALLTGEVRHHHAIEAMEAGILLYDGGHAGTELPLLSPLALGLQSMADAVQYPLQVYVAGSTPYPLQ